MKRFILALSLLSTTCPWAATLSPHLGIPPEFYKTPDLLNSKLSCARHLVPRIYRRLRKDLLHWSAVYISEEAVIRHIERRLARQPVRDLSQSPAATEYLKQHRVYVSLTTSPRRLSNITHALDTLDLTHVESILLVLPDRFERDGSSYNIPNELYSYPKLKIIRTQKDLGPATKIVPAIDMVGIADPDALVISIDDDTGYPKGMVNEMIYATSLFPDGVIAASAQNLSDLNLPSTELHTQAHEQFSSGEATVRVADFVEGYAGVAYRPRMLDTHLVRGLSEISAETRTADDLTISVALARRGIPMLRYHSPYWSLSDIRQFEYGHQSDALWKGAGISTERAIPVRGSYHPYRYRIALEQILKYLRMNQ